MFFNKKKELTREEYLPFPKELPNGVIVHYENNYYLINKGQSLRFLSPRAMWSWLLKPLACKIDHIPPVANTVGFRNGSLIQNAKDGKIYFISDGLRRLLTSPIEDYGFDWVDVISVSDEEVNFHIEGDDL